MADQIVGFEGDTLLVNGAINPYVEVPQGITRFRLLNGSNGRNLELRFSNKQEFYQIASDGGFLEKPVEMDEIILGPGERAEILVDFSKMKKGDRVQLLDQGVVFMDLLVNTDPEKMYKIPETLAEIKKISPSIAGKTREFIFQGTGKSEY